MYAQTNLVAYMKSDDIKGFIQFCNQDAELAIKDLITFSLNDTINLQIWYDETIGNRISIYEKSTEGIDRFYASLRLKSYYWILKIYHSDYDSIKENICVFVGENNSIIFDYEILGQEEIMNAIEKIIIEEEKKKFDFQYKKNPSIYLNKLEQSFKEWFSEMKEKGLDYMRKQNIPPIIESRYKIFKPFQQISR